VIKKPSMRFVLLGGGLLILLIFVFLQNVYLWPGCYKSNSLLEKEANKEIKSLLLSAMKDHHSTFFSIDENKLYTEEYRLEYLQEDMSTIEKSVYIRINHNFMDSVEKTGENEYTARIQMHFPDDWCYYFTIRAIDGQYIISYLEVDP